MKMKSLYLTFVMPRWEYQLACTSKNNRFYNSVYFFFFNLFSYFIQANTESQMVIFPTYSWVTEKKK